MRNKFENLAVKLLCYSMMIMMSGFICSVIYSLFDSELPIDRKIVLATLIPAILLFEVVFYSISKMVNDD